MHAIRYRATWLLCLAIASITLSACHLDRRALGSSWATTASPEQYCPGDTATVAYDFLAEMTCAADVDCTPYFPNVDFSSDPASFPPQRITNYVGSVSFMPSADVVAVSVTADRDEVLIPTDEIGEHGRVVAVRPVAPRTVTRYVRRIDDLIEESQVYGGFCAGASHAYAPATLAPLPRYSPNLELTEICNASPVPIFISAPSWSDWWGIPLSIGQCAPISIGIPAGTMISARPQTMDPTARCSALDGGTPPRALQTRARLACR